MIPTLTIFLLIISFAALILAVLLVVRSVGHKRIRRLKASISESKKVLSDYGTFQKYMRNLTKRTLVRSLSEIQPDIIDKFGGLRTELEALFRERDSLKEFTTTYNTKYIVETQRRHKDFFGPLNLNDEQVVAVIKDDRHNLVIAPAGSGKTRVLTTRIALFRKMGADPGKILALAYTAKAAEEMQQRLVKDFGITDVEIKTFHSFGRRLSRNYSRKFRSGVADADEQRDFIKQSIKYLLTKDRNYQIQALNYAVACSTFEADPDDHPDPKEYYEFMKSQRYTTLNNKRVKSIAERDIGNFLFLNQVEFKYGSEATVNWAPRNRQYRDYQPDFVLPEYDDLCIEHWALGRDGTVPAWFSPIGSATEATEKYRRTMAWKNEVFAAANRVLIQTFSYQWYEGTLLDKLRAQLVQNNVILKERNHEEILQKLKETMPRHDHLEDAVLSFMNNAKGNALTFEEVNQRIREKNRTPRQRLLAELTTPVWQRYEDWLAQNNKMDFNDMVVFAIDALKQQKNGIEEKPDYILIDEFQDITNSQVELIKLLMNGNEKASLFCVGDDWQSIFSFAGADIDNFLLFNKNFPDPETTFLKINYRCPKNVVDLSNLVISYNKSRKEKDVIARSQKVIPVEYFQMPFDEGGSYDVWEVETAKQVLKKISSEKGRNETILVLSRYNLRNDILEKRCLDIADPNIGFLSVHRAKGKEADYVLLLGCISGEYGFPSEITNEDEIDIARRTPELLAAYGKIEEERRLFYVAVTRCKKRLYFFSSNRAKSRFISEIEPLLETSSTL